MLKIDFSLIIQIANFLFLLFILNIILYRPIRKILGKRNDEMRSFQETIDDFRGKSERYDKELEENRVEARKTGLEEMNGLKGEGVEEGAGILQKASSSAEEKVGKAREGMRDTLEGVRKALESDVEGFSKELVEKILGRSV